MDQYTTLHWIIALVQWINTLQYTKCIDTNTLNLLYK